MIKYSKIAKKKRYGVRFFLNTKCYDHVIMPFLEIHFSLPCDDPPHDPLSVTTTCPLTMVPPRSQLDLDQAPLIIPDCDTRTITTSTSSNLACYPLYRQPTITLDHLLRHRHTSTSPLTHPPNYDVHLTRRCP